MPSLKMHEAHSFRFLKMLNVKPDLKAVRDVNLFIDDPRGKAPELRERAMKDPAVRECLERSFDDLTIIWLFESFKHDMRGQRVSPKRIDWSRNLISAGRRFIACLYGREYGLLVDLHHLLDMAAKFCCDDETLLSWAGEVGIDGAVLDYYRRYKQEIERDLDCEGRRRRGRCSRRDIYWLLRSDNR